uniref:Helitron helicase-like domain-containing protein n=1 Tax=Brassica oleracea var. oleracea TaxID=109376 RepID=A0A0D3D3Z8_BRAOL
MTIRGRYEEEAIVRCTSSAIDRYRREASTIEDYDRSMYILYHRSMSRREMRDLVPADFKPKASPNYKITPGEPQSGGYGSQAVQMPHISSPRFGKLSQTPYVVATSMGYCKRKRLKNLQCPTPTRNKFARSYVDEGNSTIKCEYYKAKMWYGERLDRKTRSKKKPIFSLCCGQGQVKLPTLRESPLAIKQLLYGKDEKSRYYQKNLRALNMLFSFTSLSGKVDRSIPNGLYIVDIDTEVDDRDSVMSKYNTEADKAKKQALRKQIIEDIIKVLDDVNPYGKQFRQARERLSMEPNEKIHMRIVSNHEKD